MRSKGTDLLGSFEQLILLALARLGDDAYGMTVRREIAERTGREAALGAVYATLDRLERKGLIASHAGPSESTRGGRPKRFFKIQAQGRKSLRHTLDCVDRLREDLPGLQPNGATA